jgi:NACHT domain/Restriction endonuclease
MDLPDSKLFEIQVANLLRLAGFHIQPEMYISHKKVDIYAEKLEFGKRRRYAVECKAWDRVLTLKQIQLIENDYRKLYELNKIDVILLVTKIGLAPAAQTFVSSSRNLAHVTFQDLHRGIMDFSDYLKALIYEYEEDGLHRYYVPAEALNDKSSSRIALFQVIGDWIDNDQSPPIALLGGYGSGKTTFTRHIAYYLAKEFQSLNIGRIPIFIKLGDLCVEQTIEGLLGRLFASTHRIQNYSFGLFQELNRSGLFLIILDGFDEMKHSMTTGVFRYTFRELLKLVNSKSKIILSGRPTAFLNDTERMEFLHAFEIRGDKKISIKGRPNFQEIFIAPFEPKQITAFISKYQSYLRSEKNYEEKDIPTHEAFFQSETLIELASRPVQLQMLFEVLPDYKGNISTLTVRELYTYFIDKLIAKEAEKPARKRFSAKRRRDFLHGVAFFMWIKSSLKLSTEEIPLIEFFTPTELDSFSDIDDIRRDLISGSFLEVRYPDQIYFPHRSIQEYLIAEFLIGYFKEEETKTRFSRAIGATINFEFLDERVSPEIIEFMIAAIGDNDRAILFGGLNKANRALSLKVLNLWLSSNGIWKTLLNLAEAGDLWAFALLIAGCTEYSWLTAYEERIQVYELSIKLLEPANDKDREFVYQTLYLTWILVSAEPDKELRKHWLCRCLGAFLSFYHFKWSKTKKESLPVRPQFIDVIAKSIKFDSAKKKVDVGNLESILFKDTRTIGLTSWYKNKSVNFELVQNFSVNQFLEEILRGEKIER